MSFVRTDGGTDPSDSTSSSPPVPLRMSVEASEDSGSGPATIAAKSPGRRKVLFDPRARPDAEWGVGQHTERWGGGVIATGRGRRKRMVAEDIAVSSEVGYRQKGIFHSSSFLIASIENYVAIGTPFR